MRIDFRGAFLITLVTAIVVSFFYGIGVLGFVGTVLFFRNFLDIGISFFIDIMLKLSFAYFMLSFVIIISATAIFSLVFFALHKEQEKRKNINRGKSDEKIKKYVSKIK